MEVWVDPVEGNNHFGVTPIYCLILDPEQLQADNMLTQQDRNKTSTMSQDNMTAP